MRPAEPPGCLGRAVSMRPAEPLVLLLSDGGFAAPWALRRDGGFADLVTGAGGFLLAFGAAPAIAGSRFLWVGDDLPVAVFADFLCVGDGDDDEDRTGWLLAGCVLKLELGGAMALATRHFPPSPVWCLHS